MRLTLHPEEMPKENPFQKEKTSFKDLTWKKKLEFIWDYYKIPIISVVVIAIVVGLSLPQIIENQKEVALYTVFVNTEMTDTDDTPQFLLDYAEEKDIDIEGKRLMIDCSLAINHENPTTYSMECTQKLTAMFAAGQPDVVVSDIDTFESYVQYGVYVDLAEVMSEEFMEKYADKLIYASVGEEEEAYAYAIDVSDSQVLADEGAYIVSAYLSIAVNSSQPENAAAFLEYLLGE